MVDNNEKVNKTIAEELKKNKRKKKGIIVGIVAVFAAVAAVITGVVAHFTKKNKNNDNNEIYGPDTVETNYIDEPNDFDTLDSIDKVVSIDDLGANLVFPTKNLDNSNYGEVISNDPSVIIDANKLVEVKEIVTEHVIENGKEKIVEKEEIVIYINEEAKDKAKNIGKTTIDDKNGTIVIEDGKAKVTEEGYQIIDESGKTIETGNKDVPQGYVEDVTSEYIKEEDLEDIVMLNNDIWVINNGEPTILFNKYDYVTKEAYSKIQLDIKNGNLFDYKPNVDIAETIELINEEPVETSEIEETVKIDIDDTTLETEEITTTSNKGILNEDGTYTFNGETFRNYETFLSIADDVNIINIDGIWWLVSDYEEYLTNSTDYEYVKTR